MLQPLDSPDNLFYLIRFSHTFVVLDIDAWVALPGHPVDPMTGATLPWNSEVMIAHQTQVRESYPLGIGSHLIQNISNPCHD
jgi:hypothetical protein